MADTDELTEMVTRKVGPLPVGVWIIAIGGGIGIALYMRRNAAAQDVPTEQDTTDYAQGGNTFTPAGVGSAAGSSSSTPLPSAPADNDEWFRRAADYLTAKGMSGSVVQHALSLWLGGESIDNQERAIVDMAIAGVGNPPVAPPPAANKPPSPPIGIPRPVPSMPGVPGPAPKPAKPATPAKPSIVSLDSAAGRGTFKTNTVPGATSYRWFLKASTGQMALANSTAGPSVTLTRLARHTFYSVSVQAMNSAGTSPLSAAYGIKTN